MVGVSDRRRHRAELLPFRGLVASDAELLERGSTCRATRRVLRITTALRLLHLRQKLAGLVFDLAVDRARWKLGKLLAMYERGKPGPKAEGVVLSGLTQFRAYLKEIGLTPPTAQVAQRIGTMPEGEPFTGPAISAGPRHENAPAPANARWWRRVSRRCPLRRSCAPLPSAPA